MTITIKNDQKSTFHHDGSVSFWSCVESEWRREGAQHISDEELSTFPPSERGRIIKMQEKHQAIWG